MNLTTLQTVVIEIEAILNDRPLTYISTDVNDEEPLTPAHLLYGRRITPLPNETLQGDEINDPSFDEIQGRQRDAKHLVILLQHFYKRWRQEYLTSLREFHRTTGVNAQKIKVGDIVQVHDDKHRLNWKLAVVEGLVQGLDGHVRVANIRTKTGKTNRPIAKLYPLEITVQTEHLVPESRNDGQPQQESSRNNKRKAAIRARECIKNGQENFVPPPEDVEKI